MRKLLALLLSLVPVGMSACSSQPAFAMMPPEARETIVLKLAKNLLPFAAKDQDLPVPGTLPRIKFAPQCAIQQLYYDNAADKCDGPLRIMAAYVNGSSVLYLRDDFDPTSMQDQSILLHELAHYAQDMAGIPKKVMKDHGCIGSELEMPAYQAQFHWIQSMGLDPWVTSGVTPMSLMFSTMCSNPWERIGQVGPR